MDLEYEFMRDLKRSLNCVGVFLRAAAVKFNEGQVMTFGCGNSKKKNEVAEMIQSANVN